jgi:hypothetical protein
MSMQLRALLACAKCGAAVLRTDGPGRSTPRAASASGRSRSTCETVGEGNDELILDAVKYAKRYRTPVVVAWGAHAKPDRVAEVEQLIASEFVVPLCLGVTKDGAPRDPLYVPYETALRPWPIRPSGSPATQSAGRDEARRQVLPRSLARSPVDRSQPS